MINFLKNIVLCILLIGLITGMMAGFLGRGCWTATDEFFSSGVEEMYHDGGINDQLMRKWPNPNTANTPSLRHDNHHNVPGKHLSPATTSNDD